MDGHRHEGMSDETLEREIEAALGIDPSPEFLPRIRARIASERVNEVWLWRGLWQWAGAGVAVAGVAIIGLWILNGPASGSRDVRVANAPQRPGPASDSGMVADAANSGSSPTPAPVRRPAAYTTRVPRDRMATPPEVVISRDEAVALRQLIAAIAARQVEAVDIPKLEGESAPIAPIEEIVLEPIELSPMAGLEGE
ncbi:MAG TPA: hypothetical protein VFB92_10405 [Vicinamibacterales bacterium]|nr:hypothetical protein [Vicinamibacterales bacterium]